MRVGGGVSGTDYPWKAINLPWDMDKRQKREEGMHVLGSVQTTVILLTPAETPVSAIPILNQFLMSQNLIANVFGFLRCNHSSLSPPPPWDHVTGIFQGENNEGHKRGNEMDDTASGIMGYMWVGRVGVGPNLCSLELQSCIVSTSQASINCGILSGDVPHSAHISSSEQTDFCFYFMVLCSLPLSSGKTQQPFCFWANHIQLWQTFITVALDALLPVSSTLNKEGRHTSDTIC